MSVPVTTRQQLEPARPGLLAGAGALAVTAVLGTAVTLAAPGSARPWTAGTAVVAGAAVAVLACVAAVTARRSGRTAAAAAAEVERLRGRLAQAGARAARAADDAAELADVILPAVVRQVRDGASAGTALDRVPGPGSPQLDRLLRRCAEEIAVGERRSAAAMAAAVKAVDRVQAQANTILAQLRDMQDRYDEEVLGDLMTVDHHTAQLSLLADRLAVLMGGTASRQWNKPIVMERILRGAVGRIAAYPRVRLHCTSTAAIVGYAAEGVMHALAELMDNAANFSPPTDEVHVYVEERTAGLVVTIEDSGLTMADAALRRAEECVSGCCTDLATLQGTRLGLAVVGRLTMKHRLTVSFRPSSRGGTGVVVLVPQELIAQPPLPEPAATVPAPAATPAGEWDTFPAPRRPRPPSAPSVASAPADGGGGDGADGGGLPKRQRGRTLAASPGAPAPQSGSPPPAIPPAAPAPHRRPHADAGSRFSAFRDAGRPPSSPPTGLEARAASPHHGSDRPGNHDADD
ncbi:sensor histidine kinase [Streptomyces sp. GSL17-111]|uniref:sensor histidine kinase n=1 Tax=Streptomyces sp. GSL17-111 TaxID=3121596 RepID=UPI0030F47EF5